MTWQEIRSTYSSQWVVVEALNAYTEGGKRLFSQLSVEGSFNDWQEAWAIYKDLHHVDKFREYYVLHTSNEHLDIGVIDAFGRVVEEAQLRRIQDRQRFNTERVVCLTHQPQH